MQIHCPNCNTVINLTSALEDNSARQLFAELSQHQYASAFINYLMLFKPPLQGLRWSRALAITLDCLQRIAPLNAADEQIRMALIETVESMRDKRQQPHWKPLSNHNYFLKVLESGMSSTTITANKPSSHQQSKTAQALQLFDHYQHTDIPLWFTQPVCAGLKIAFIKRKDNLPATDMLMDAITYISSELWPRRRWTAQGGYYPADRLQQIIKNLIESTGQWPTPSDIIRQVPKVD